MQTLALGSYHIHIGPIGPSVSAFLKGRHFSQLFVLVDENTKAHCWPAFAPALSGYPSTLIEIPAGETHKNIATCQLIWEQLMKASAARDALLINLGGGVIGDMGGFAASTFKRGIPFIQVPTTLLSQVDASIGGKLGIDFMQVKNSIGLFSDPQAVLIDPAFLRTLSGREIRSGYAEILKHSLIADAGQWGRLNTLAQLDTAEWSEIIPQSLLVKQRIVAADPFEKGIRKALNFGHTIGHAVEGIALETDTPLLHGEAIAVGMICEAWLSHKKLGLPQETLHTITNYLLRVYGKPAIHKTDYTAYLQLMGNDKKNEGQAINFSLLPAAGQVEVNCTATQEQIIGALDYYRQLPSPAPS
ncbi:3-dehydroquinate synthase [Phaeodactylibacter luteus]|uniref:3-dehydroquinate synthase n=1 Tax=Phaeodactylibacter luteus TaxID=1564516 RepID=A0A5C6RTX9_9BACT|nr:3-dehydroquinate synthase [Phaeodactylibacter luteus]TXB65557.1 3-dehydroquinate synthase [Phaeodactylibacter luteus]